MKHTKKILSLFMTLIMIISIIPMSSITASADAYFPTFGTCGESLTWSFDEETRTLTIDGTGEMTNFSSGGHPWEDYEDSITSVIIGDYVTTIGSYAFYNCNSLTCVTIPDGVTEIGYGAFIYCSSLTNVTISDSVTTIDWGAFSHCENLTSINIPDSVITIGSCAFRYCTSLTSITVDINNQYYSSDEYGVLFNKDKNTLIRYPSGNARISYTIPDCVTIIDDEAFSDCTNLVDVTIPDSVTSIDGYAFESCTSLTNVTIPDNVTTIDWGAFSYCTGLESITIGNGVQTIGGRAFYNCTSLTSVTIGNNVASIGDCAFYDCSSLMNIEVLVGNTSFSSQNGILFNNDKTTLIQYPAGKTDTSYEIPNNTTIINEHAFYNCSSLTNIIISDSVVTIGYGAFADCFSLTSVIIGNSLTLIGDSAFRFCTNLTNITIPDSVTIIGEAAFQLCDSLIDIYFFGAEEQWDVISINDYNESLTNSTIHYNCTSEHYTEIIVKPTCVNPGKTTYSCKCGIERIQENPATGHVYENGVCTACNISEDHTCEYEITEQKNATCYEDGYTTYTCSECGHYYTDVIYVYHDYGDWVITTEPTCTTGGEKEKTCSECGYSYRESIPIKHNYEKIAEGQFKCTECGNINTKYIELVPNDSHADVGDIVTVDVNIKNCSELSALTFDVIYDNTVFEIVDYDVYDILGGVVNSNYGSKFRYTGATASMLGSDNETVVRIYFKVLDLGGEIFVDVSESINYDFSYINISNAGSIKIGHTYEEIITKQPTCTEQGYTTYTCECGDSYVDDYIDALGHKTVAVEVISATCQQAGKQYDMCETCGETLTDLYNTPVSNHIPGNWEILTEATSTTDGKRVKKCIACGTVVAEEIIPVTGNDDIGYVIDNNTGVNVEYPKNEYDGEVGINVEEVIDDADSIYQLVNSDGSVIKSKPYDITMTLDGDEIQPNGFVTVKIPLPEGYKPEYSHIKHIDLNTGAIEDIESEYIDGYLVFKTNHFSIYVVVEEYNYTFSIQTPSRTEIRNKDGIILHAKVDGTAPTGSYVRWESSNGNFDEDANGYDLEIIAKNKGWTTFTAILCAEDGTELARSSVEMYSKSGFFDKIGGFFRSLFGTAKIYDN